MGSSGVQALTGGRGGVSSGVPDSGSVGCYTSFEYLRFFVPPIHKSWHTRAADIIS